MHLTRHLRLRSYNLPQVIFQINFTILFHVEFDLFLRVKCTQMYANLISQLSVLYLKQFSVLAFALPRLDVTESFWHAIFSQVKSVIPFSEPFTVDPNNPPPEKDYEVFFKTLKEGITGKELLEQNPVPTVWFQLLKFYNGIDYTGSFSIRLSESFCIYPY